MSAVCAPHAQCTRAAGTRSAGPREPGLWERGGGPKTTLQGPGRRPKDDRAGAARHAAQGVDMRGALITEDDAPRIFYLPVLAPVDEQTAQLTHRRCSLSIRELMQAEPQDFFPLEKYTAVLVSR